jgi:hypothetical protein
LPTPVQVEVEPLELEQVQQFRHGVGHAAILALGVLVEQQPEQPPNLLPASLVLVDAGHYTRREPRGH